MGKRWTDSDLKNLQAKGMTVTEQITSDVPVIPIAKKIVKISVEKNTIEFILRAFLQQGIIPEYVTEHQFDQSRKFRFDWAIPSLMLAIEYEGIFSEKSGHTTVTGYASDIEKYNMATLQGWKILRYTALNYSDLAQDIELFLSNL